MHQALEVSPMTADLAEAEERHAEVEPARPLGARRPRHRRHPRISWDPAVTGRNIYDPTDAMGKLFFNILATFAEFEVDLLRMRTREGMAVAKAKGKLRGNNPKCPARQQSHLVALHEAGDHTIADLAELFTGSRPTVYRVLERHRAGTTDA
jgi:resolvase-like protein/helix-turn-helix resolvase-like protein